MQRAKGRITSQFSFLTNKIGLEGTTDDYIMWLIFHGLLASLRKSSTILAIQHCLHLRLLYDFKTRFKLVLYDILYVVRDKF